MLRVGLIGPGRAGQALARLLPQFNYEIGPVLSSTYTSARRVTRQMRLGSPTASFEDFAGCGLILITVPDDAVVSVASKLAAASFSFRRKVVLHASGALDSSALAPVQARGASIGSMHPLQTFGSRVLSLSGVYFAVEGDETAMRLARSLVTAWHGKLLRIRPSQKTLYHAAATFASPLFAGLMEAAVRLMGRAGVGPETAIQALRPLLITTFENYLHTGKRSWTGPLARGDVETVRRHLDALSSFDPNLARYYRTAAFSALILFNRHPGLQRILKKDCI